MSVTICLQLCTQCSVVIVVGGRNSNNTRQLVATAQALGARAYQVETASDLQATWLSGAEDIGLTAGTSTLDETVEQVRAALLRLAAAA